MKNFFLILLLIPSLCFGQTKNIRNDNNVSVIGANGLTSELGAANQQGGRVIIPFAAQPATWSGCTNDITDTTNTQISAGVASTVKCVTDLTISNLDDTTPTVVLVNQGSTRIWQCPAATLGGGCTKTFAVPICGASAAAINCQPVTTGSTTRCCAAGYLVPQ